MKKTCLTVALLLWLVPHLAAAAVGDGFHPPIYTNDVRGIAVQPWDGKVVIAGEFMVLPGSQQREILRLNPDGSRDTSFELITDSLIYGMIPLPDRTFLVYGDFNTVTYKDANGVFQTVARPCLARIDAHGVPDSLALQADPGTWEVDAAVLMPDRKSIVVGGWFDSIQGVAVSNLARISLEPATYGQVDPGFPTVDDMVWTMALQDDNGIVVSGFFTSAQQGGTTYPHSYLVRIRGDATVDESFSATPNDLVEAIELQPDGKILVGGYFTGIVPNGGGGEVVRHGLARLTRFGEVDASFAPDPGTPTEVGAVKLQPDGKILIGGSLHSIDGVPVSYVARLNQDGSVDPFGASLPHRVGVFALQPDGKIIMGYNNFGGVVTTNPLPRYYPDGTLDDDVGRTGVLPNKVTDPVALAPDGMLTVGGIFTQMGSEQRVRVARLKPDWTLADPARFDPGLQLGITYAFSLQEDGKMLTGGHFWLSDCPLDVPICDDSWITSDRRVPHLARIDATGHYDPALDANGKTFYQNVQTLMTDYKGDVFATAVVPRGYPYAGMAYVGGFFGPDADHPGLPEYYLMRLKPNGERDPSFAPAELMKGVHGFWSGRYAMGRVTVVAIQPDGKLLAAANGVTDEGSTVINRAVLLRFLPESGALDPTFIPFYVNSNIYAIALQRDGQIVIGGRFTYPIEKEGVTYQQNIVRLNNGRPGYADGTLDDTLVLQGTIANPLFQPLVNDLSLQADGSIVIAGVFDQVKDRLGQVARDDVVKIGPDGTIDRPYDLGPINWYGILDKVTTAVLQPDGKLIVTGGFESLGDGSDTRHNLARFANDTPAFQDFGISADGGKISWLRDGSAPEVWGVTFDDSPDGTNWTFLGNGSPIPGGWGLDLTTPVRLQSRYLRARGYAAVSSKNSVLVEEKRLYYLKPVLTVRPRAITRSYGTANPPLEVEYLGFADGDSAANSLVGAPVLATAANAGSAAGTYPITAALGTLASAKYTLVVADTLLTVTPAPLTVSVAPSSRPYGDPDPAPGWSASSLKNSDTISGVTFTSSATTWSPAGSAQALTPGSAVFSAGAAANYAITYLPGALTITKRELVVRADDQHKSAGHANPVLTVSYTGFAPSEGAGVLAGTPSLSTAVDLSTPAGNYPITIAPGTLASGNYSFTFVGGTFYVADPMPQTITFTLPEHTYGDGDFLPGAVSTSGLTVSYASADETVASVVVDLSGQERIRVKAPGTVQITARQGGSWQYLPAADVTRLLTVHPPPWNGVSFDGADDVLVVPDQARLKFAAGESFTLEAWLRLAGSQPDGAGILSKGGGGGAGYALLLHQNRLAFELSDGVTSLTPADGAVGSTTLDDGMWHQVALSVDRQGGMARLFLDGRLEKELAVPPALGSLASGADLLAGVDGSGTRYFAGEADELRVWKAARTMDEVRGAASVILEPAAQGELVAYLHLDEGSAGGGNAGVTGAPERAFGNDGVLSGFALSGAGSNWVRSGAFAPLLETTPISALPLEGAVAGGVIYLNPFYPPTDRGLCWGSAPNPGVADSCTHLGAGATGSFVSTIGGLTPGATYHLRAFAVNGQGTAYGNDLAFQAARRDQSTTFGALPVKTYGDPDFNAGGTSGSGLPLTYASSDPAVATVAGDTVHITGAGTTTITASQPGDGTYNPATDVPQLFTVLPAPLTVRADDKSRPYKSPDPPFTASLTGFVNGENAAVVTGAPAFSTTALWGSDAGSYPISVAAGSLAARNYRFVFAGGTLSITRSGQCITFPLIGERTFGDSPFTVSAAACSGRPVSFVSSDSSIVRVDGSTLVVVGTGTVTITARETGDGNFEGANEVSQTVVVHKAGQQVVFSSLAQKVVGDPPFPLAATATSGLPVSYESSDPAVALVTGSTVTVVAPGTAVITARQGGNGNYNPAPPVLQTLTVAQEGVPPLLALSTLSSGSVTSNAVLNIQGGCTDLSGIASVTVNGAELGGAGVFSVPLLLGAGTNSVTVSALDGAGNRTTESRTVVLQGSGPALAVATPADNAVTFDAQLLLQGTAGEGSSVAVSLNGSTPAGLALVGGGFSATITLAQGVNTIEVNAERGGVKSALKRSVILAPGKPAVAITSPVQDLLTDAGRVTLSGSVGGDPPLALSLSVNGVTYTPPLTAGVFQQEIALDAPGTYRISATATSAAASSVAYRNIIRTAVVRGDLDGDGIVDVGDAMRALTLSLGMEPVTPAALAHADVAPLVNGVPHPDGVIDVGDVIVILRKAVGLIDF